MSFDVDFAIRNFYIALSGVPTTLLVTFVAVSIGLPLGFFIAVIRYNKVPVFSQFFAFYISVLRGVPVVVLIFLVYAALPLALKGLFASFGVEIKATAINPLLYAFLVFGLKSSATFSEMWRAGLNSVSRGQMEACEIIGISPFYAYSEVIIPQVFATVSPSFCSMVLSLLKETSLVFIMTVQDITAKCNIAAGLEYKYIEGFVDALLVYVIVCTALEFVLKKWEIRLNYYRDSASAN